MPLKLLLPTVFPHSALNEDPVQQRDLQMSAPGLHFLGIDIRRPNQFWKPRLYCWAAEPLWTKPGQQLAGHFLLQTWRESSTDKKRLSSGKIRPNTLPFWTEEGKYFTFALLVPAGPAAPLFPLVPEVDPSTSQLPQDHQSLGVPWEWAPFHSPFHHPGSCGDGSSRPGKSLSACLHLCSPHSTSSRAALKSFISKLVDFTWQAWGSFEVAINHMAEFQFSLCF